MTFKVTLRDMSLTTSEHGQSNSNWVTGKLNQPRLNERVHRERKVSLSQRRAQTINSGYLIVPLIKTRLVNSQPIKTRLVIVHPIKARPDTVQSIGARLVKVQSIKARQRRIVREKSYDTVLFRFIFLELLYCNDQHNPQRPILGTVNIYLTAKFFTLFSSWRQKMYPILKKCLILKWH